jgi:hypothetical protein
MTDNSENKNVCPNCHKEYPKSMTQCAICGYKFNNTIALSSPDFKHLEDRTIWEKYPWIRYFGLFGLAGIFFGVIILLSKDMITNTEKSLSGYFWVSQAISGGVISLLIGCIQLFIFHQNIKKKYYFLFLVSSLASGIIAGYLIVHFVNLDFSSDAFLVGLLMGAFSGAFTSIAQGTFVFNKKSHNYGNVLSKWIIYHILSWSIIWGLGWMVSWHSYSTQSLALGFVVIMILSGGLFAAFLNFMGNIDYA